MKWQSLAIVTDIKLECRNASWCWTDQLCAALNLQAMQIPTATGMAEVVVAQTDWPMVLGSTYRMVGTSKLPGRGWRSWPKVAAEPAHSAGHTVYHWLCPTLQPRRRILHHGLTSDEYSLQRWCAFFGH